MWGRRAARLHGRSGVPPLPRLLWAEIRRLLLIAWSGILTLPIPVLSVPKALDLALLFPLMALEARTLP